MTAGAQHRPVHNDRLPAPVPDVDPSETQEWVESLDGLVDHAGRTRARGLMLSVLRRARVAPGHALVAQPSAAPGT